VLSLENAVFRLYSLTCGEDIYYNLFPADKFVLFFLCDAIKKPAIKQALKINKSAAINA